MWQVRPRDLIRFMKPKRDSEYLKWIRRFPCIGCGGTRRIEAMHTGPHGMGQKSADDTALPGCHSCHRTGPNALHKIGPVRFQEVHHLDFDALRTMFQHMYELKKGKAA